METSDKQLLVSYRKGDLSAMEELVQRHRRSLFGFILGMTGTVLEAEDVFQEVWIRVLKKLDRYRDDNFGGWLVRVAHNLYVDRTRKRKPDMSLDEEDPASGRTMVESFESPEPDPAEHAQAGELGKAINAAVATLPCEQREVFVLRTQVNMPFKEIAKVQETSINTVLARMHYALGKLRPMLKTHYEPVTE